VARDKNEAINSYLSDMLSLEDHIEKAIRGQLQDLKDYPDVIAELKEIHRKVEHHISDLRELTDRRNAGGVVTAVKRAGSAVAGAAAGLLDLIRSEGLPKNLRDDYTALSLATVGYEMLHTTALALEDREVAELAHVNFSDYARAVIRLNTIIPGAVLSFLKSEGLPVREGVLRDVGRNIEEVWSSASAAALPSREAVRTPSA
jgi:ferritin-like metal-binding protein YciE